MARRFALLFVACLALAPAMCRKLDEKPDHSAGRPAPARPCVPEGRGTPPRHWIGCATDPGARRDLSGRERLLLGFPIDLNRATAEDLATVPGLSARLAGAVVENRARDGPFESVDDLIRVRGIGPVRLSRARPALTVSGVAQRGELR